MKETPQTRIVGKRLLIFFAIFFLPAIFITYFLFVWLNNAVLVGFILILIMGILFLLFWLLCDKIGKKKAEKMKDSNKKDPFKEG